VQFLLEERSRKSRIETTSVFAAGCLAEDLHLELKHFGGWQRPVRGFGEESPDGSYFRHSYRLSNFLRLWSNAIESGNDEDIAMLTHYLFREGSDLVIVMDNAHYACKSSRLGLAAGVSTTPDIPEPGSLAWRRQLRQYLLRAERRAGHVLKTHWDRVETLARRLCQKPYRLTGEQLQRILGE
jgi:hypothetical protein